MKNVPRAAAGFLLRTLLASSKRSVSGWRPCHPLQCAQVFSRSQEVIEFPPLEKISISAAAGNLPDMRWTADAYVFISGGGAPGEKPSAAELERCNHRDQNSFPRNPPPPPSLVSPRRGRQVSGQKDDIQRQILQFCGKCFKKKNAMKGAERSCAPWCLRITAEAHPQSCAGVRDVSPGRQTLRLYELVLASCYAKFTVPRFSKNIESLVLSTSSSAIMESQGQALLFLIPRRKKIKKALCWKSVIREQALCDVTKGRRCITESSDR